MILPLKETVKRAEINAICEALRRNEGNMTRAAVDLQVSRQALYRIISKYHIKKWVKLMRGR